MQSRRGPVIHAQRRWLGLGLASWSAAVGPYFDLEPSGFGPETLQASLLGRPKQRGLLTRPAVAQTLRFLLVDPVSRRRAYGGGDAVRVHQILRMAAARTGTAGGRVRALPDGGGESAPYGRSGAARRASTAPRRAYAA